ncbi:mechanosensitive ion channel family protein [Halomarina litorea]|uniref:mechanosensitive ion channel family protein n=1 Tax=Halomarina litorea TaxID=2961595 RepID=UPI0020C2FBD0|nr:mechanosensitive ion channel family protein [Halomarina sp. BCD28]
MTPLPVPLQTPQDDGPTVGTENVVGDLLQEFGAPADFANPVGQVLIFVVVFAALYALGRAVLKPLVGRLLDRRGLGEHAKTPLLKATGIVVVFVAVAVAFGTAGFGDFLTSLATIAAAATLAIGLAMQDVLQNFVAGVFIYTDKPFRIGDWIEWDDGTYSGIVEDISLRVTRVRTFDNELLTVPNSQLTDGVIKNPVAKNKLRLKFVFGIGYEDDVQTASDIIVREAEEHGEILSEPAPSVRLTELADSYVGLQSRIWIPDPSRADFVRIRGEYVTNVKRAFDEAGISIPFPQRDLSGGLALANPQVARAESDD